MSRANNVIWCAVKQVLFSGSRFDVCESAHFGICRTLRFQALKRVRNMLVDATWHSLVANDVRERRLGEPFCRRYATSAGPRAELPATQASSLTSDAVEKIELLEC
jgi:hypothetical protein